ncbi:uncharacterized protein LOC132556558 [Ylistrum balloti]|uniref:uncharacterized protein LOC132556558 n=1 Tax=Ylistrum balloti TaxID=509963 RepID=UPI002905B31D|nr:uncharacterized protein LOC132556558 [Ylistrum balloti]
MTTVNTSNIDEVFKCLRENKPITSDLIKKSSSDYESLKEALRNREEKSKGQQPADLYQCPKCKKNIPYPHPNLKEEIDRLTQELDDRTKKCQQMEQHITTQDQQITTQDQQITQLRQINDHRGFLVSNQQAAYSFCDDIARAQMTNMEGELYCPLSTWTEDARVEFIGRKTALPQKSARMAHHYRKSTSTECVPAIQNAFIAQILPEFMDPTLHNNRQVLAYVKRCVEITWYMVIQETPMVLISKVNRKSPFDTNIFRYYSTQGDKFDFVVWPALLMYSDGPIIIKGFAYALDPNRSIPNLREIEMETNRVPPKGKEDMDAAELNQGLAGGTPWGSNYFSNAGTPSVDLPPLPSGNVSPTRVSPGRVSREEEKLTAAWKGKKKPKARP